MKQLEQGGNKIIKSSMELNNLIGLMLITNCSFLQSRSTQGPA